MRYSVSADLGGENDCNFSNYCIKKQKNARLTQINKLNCNLMD